MPAALASADILVTATGATVPVLPVAPVAAARAQAASRPLFVLDLGMPPDVDPAVGRLAGVTLIDLTALGQHLAGRAVPDQIARARAIVAAEAAAYTKRQEQAAATPVITAMHAQIRQLADAELNRLHDRLPGLTEQERAETAATVHRILRKVLHQPTVRAREFAAGRMDLFISTHCASSLTSAHEEGMAARLRPGAHAGVAGWSAQCPWPLPSAANRSTIRAQNAGRSSGQRLEVMFWSCPASTGKFIWNAPSWPGRRRCLCPSS